MTAEQRALIRRARDAAIRARIAERPDEYRKADEFDEAMARVGETCANGHPWTVESLLWSHDGKGRRTIYCRVCRREREAQLRPMRARGERRSGGGRPRSDACQRGHPWTEETTYFRPTGERECRVCKQMRNVERLKNPDSRERYLEYQRSYYERKKAAGKAA